MHALVRQRALERTEIGGAHGVCCRRGEVLRQADHRHRALWVDRVVFGGLALISHQGVVALRGNGDHVRQGADAHAPEHLAECFRTGVEENHLARSRLIRVGLDGGYGKAVGAHGDGVDGGVLAAVDFADLGRLSRVGHVQHVDLTRVRVYREQPFRRRVVGHNLRRRLIEHARAVGPQGLDRHTRIRGLVVDGLGNDCGFGRCDSDETGCKRCDGRKRQCAAGGTGKRGHGSPFCVVEAWSQRIFAR